MTPTDEPLPAPSPPSDELFHYTGVSGLLGILDSGELHLTHGKFSNDTRELLEGSEAVWAAVGRFLKKEGIQREGGSYPTGDLRDEDGIRKFMAKHVGVGLIRAMLSALESHPPFLFCLSAREDDLSQWRAYGGGGNGYVVAFDRSNLLEWNGVSCLEVVYGKDEVLDEVFEQSGAALRTSAPALAEQRSKEEISDEEFEHLIRDAVMETASTMAEPLMTLLCRYKNPAFQAEAESRLVAFPGPNAELKFRPRGVPVPYIAIKPEEKRLPITRVIVGPHQLPELAKEGAELILHEKGYDVPVEVSTVPFRTL